MENKKKILIATGIYPPEIGGPATFTYFLNKELSKNGYKSQVITYSNLKNGFDNEEGVYYTRRLKNQFARYFYFFSNLYKASKDFDVLYAMDLVSVGIPCFFVRLFNKNIKLVFRLGGDFQWERAIENKINKDIKSYYKDKENFSFKEKIVYFITNKVLKLADFIIFNAFFLRDMYANDRNINEAKTDIVRNITTNVDLNSKNKENANEKIKIFFGGRLASVKNLSALIDALNMILDEGFVNVSLDIFGDGPEKKNLETKIKDMNLGNNISLSSGLSHSDFINEMNKADIVVNISFSEINPNMVSDALNMKKIVVLTKFSEFFYVDDKNEAIFYADPNNISDIKEKLILAIKKLDNRDNIKFQNKLSASSTEVMEKHINIFNKL